jgi:hypothetical protein
MSGHVASLGFAGLLPVLPRPRLPFVMGFAVGLALFGAAQFGADAPIDGTLQIYDSVPIELQLRHRGVRDV